MNRARVLRVLGAAIFAGAFPIPFVGQVSAPSARTSLAPNPRADDVDRGTEPCVDFDAFVNDPWRAANPPPRGVERWSRRTVARAENRRQLTALLEGLAEKRDHRRGSVEQQLGDYFGACMDESSIEAAGEKPLAPMLADIAAVHDAAGVQRLIRKLHEIGVSVAFTVSSVSDYRDPASVIANVAPGGLGLLDRDTYMSSEPRSAGTRDAYRTHVARQLTRAGFAEAAARTAADEILALESRLAEASLAAAVASDPAATAHKSAFSRLTEGAPGVDWTGYFKEASLPANDVNIADPKFMKQLQRELESTPVSTWKAYLVSRLLDSAAPSLSKSFADESFAFKKAHLGDAAATASRATFCLDSTESVFGELLGRAYVERHFSPAAKAKVKTMAKALLDVLSDDVRRVTWMSEPARREALAKISSYDVKVGYPDSWTDHSSIDIRRDAFWANVVAARRFNVALDRKRIGRRVGRETWNLPPSSPGAYIDVQLNLMVLPAGFLQPWAFDPTASDAANYGAIGAGIAHDLTHAIDTLGRDFDAKGEPRNWWTDADVEGFKKVGQCTVDQYGDYAIEPGVRHEGPRVLGEALGDLAGLRLAYRAFQRSANGRPAPALGGFTPEQQFFIAWGRFRGASESLDLQRRMMTSDSHPTARYRVIGPPSNMPEFQQAFSCQAASPMVRPVEKRCASW
jgi:putative endopeptidase